MSQTTKILIAIIITAIVVGGAVYFLQKQQNKSAQIIAENSQESNITQNQPAKNFSTITIMIPENENIYKEKMTQFAQEGGEDPLKTIKFIEKKINIPYASDIIKASAQAAAEEIAPSGGPAKASIAYFKVQNGVAYALLDIDLDGWAGVSVSLAVIHPLVEKTLLQFSEINRVVFDYAPEDK